MAAPTIADGASYRGQVVTLEQWEETNYDGDGAFATKAVPVPYWATTAMFYLSNVLVAGTTGTVDFTLKTLDPILFDSTTGVAPLGDWDGITQVTNTTNQLITIEIGPEITADDTGSATASCRYGVRAVLPRWILYTLTFDSGTEDEDYTGHLAVEFR